MNALKRWRTGLGWTQQQAADHCGVKQQTFARAEEGAVSVETAAHIASRTDGAVNWPAIFEKRVGAASEGDDTDPTLGQAETFESDCDDTAPVPHNAPQMGVE
jgi:transcriptional regulator with XRE-family HTH domain